MQRPRPSDAPTTTARMVRFLSWVGRSRSGDDAANLEVEDRVHVETEAGEDVVTVLVELRRPLRDGRFFVELDRGGGQLEGRAGRGLAVDDVAVRQGLRVGCGLERVLHHRPLTGEAEQHLTPLV